MDLEQHRAVHQDGLARRASICSLGQEANAGNNRYLQGSIANLLSTDINSRYVQDALGDPKTKNVFSSGGKNALLSYFGKAGFNYADKYVASFTLRKDGSSQPRSGPPLGNLPGSRPRMADLARRGSCRTTRFCPTSCSDMDSASRETRRFRPDASFRQFGGDRGDTFYDISGSNTTIAPGFRQASLGNPNLKWEENRSTNVGTDIALFSG